MKKIYSIVLMATALLIGTNAWANAVFNGLASQQGENTVKVTIGGITKYAADLQTAVNAVAAGETATIQLLATQTLSAPVIIPQVETATTDEEKVVNRALQHITLDLNGCNIQPSTSPAYVGAAIMLFKGELNITGTGTIKRDGNKKGDWANFSKAAIVVCGADGDKRSGYEDRSKQEWSTLVIGPNVNVEGAGSWDSGESGAFGIAIQDFSTTTGNGTYYSALDNYIHYANLGYSTFHYTATNNMWWTGSESGSAFGVKVLISGTVKGFQRGINIVGHINQSPEIVEGSAERSGDAYPYYEHYYPYIKVEAEAKVYCNEASDSKLESGNGGIYGGGWCIIDIAGDVYGQTGVFLKAGDAVITDNGKVYSTATTGAAEADYGKNVSGNGIFVASDKNYAGNVSIQIEGSATVQGNGGAAIVDKVASATTESAVQHVEITGGTIIGGQNGAIEITAGTAANTVVYDVNLEGSNKDVTTGTTNGLLDLLPKDENGDANAYVTTTQDASGKTVLVVTSGAGSAPNAVADNFDIDNFTMGDVNLSDASLSNKNQVFDSETKSKLEIGTLMMNNTTDVVKLTIAAGHTIVAQKVIMGAKAQIIVEPGATLIINGALGINTTSVNNIVLQASETAQATFLFNPSVTSNRHPAATVEFISKSFRVNSTNYLYQRFGIPTFGALSNITAKKANGDEVQTIFSSFNGNDWEILGYLYTSGYSMDYSKMANPFEYYQMLNNNPDAGTIVTMQGELYGNESPTLNIRGSRWNGFANSFMAPIDGQVLIDMIPETVDRTFYLNRISSTEAAWDSYTLMNLDEMPNIAAMQPFLIRNENAAANVNVDYGDAVYYPTTGETKPAPAGAPRRLSPAMSDITKIKLYVRGEGSYDRLVVAEDAQFTPQFDNGYDAVKYMNEGINMYVTADKHMSIFATDNLEDTYVGFQSVNGGDYTIEFANVQGNDLTLVDLETGVQTLIVEGNTYTFNAAANTTNDYRFKIINTRGIMTGIENTEAAKSAKGIYTITGIYVGEMNLWNALPAGVYVVNGEKRVK